MLVITAFSLTIKIQRYHRIQMFLNKFENAEKFGEDRVSFTYRVVYRSSDRTLRTDEVEPIHNKLYEVTKTEFNAELR